MLLWMNQSPKRTDWERTVHRAANNGRSTDNVRPDRGLDQSNSGLAGHFDWSFLDTNTLFSIQLSLYAL